MIMNQKEVNLSVNIAALQGNFLVDIQNLLDIITFAYLGQDLVSEEKYQSQLGFMSFHPASNRRLTFQEVKEKSTQWLLASFLTHCINAAGIFLDECRKICAIFKLGKDHISGQELNIVLGREWKKFHELGFPAKFKHLRDQYKVETPFEEHFLSLNQARNCLVHRQGIVSEKDIDENGELIVKWRTMELVVTSPDGLQEIMEKPKVIESGGSLGYRFGDRERSFKVGQRIFLELDELYQSIVTLYFFATELVKSIERYGKDQGILK